MILPQIINFEKSEINGSTLILGDCLDIMPFLPEKSINAIIADLPYKKTKCDWDSILPFEKLWENYNRVLAEGGIIILNSTQPFTTKLIMSNEKMFKYCLYWKKEKGTGFVLSGKRPLMIIEDICIFYKKNSTYNPQKKLLEKPIIRTMPIVHSKSGGSNTFKNSQLNEDGSRKYKTYTHSTPNNFLEFKRDIGLHPTQKPIELLNYLIKTYTNEHDVILDNTMGSGTSVLSCLMNNRKFIGIEKEKEYYDIANKRLLNYYEKCKTQP